MKNVEFEKVSSRNSADVKMVVMKKKQMLIEIEKYNEMKNCTAVGEDEVVMKKKKVEEKDKRIEELKAWWWNYRG